MRGLPVGPVGARRRGDDAGVLGLRRLVVDPADEAQAVALGAGQRVADVLQGLDAGGRGARVALLLDPAAEGGEVDDDGDARAGPGRLGRRRGDGDGETGDDARAGGQTGQPAAGQGAGAHDAHAKVGSAARWCAASRWPNGTAARPRMPCTVARVAVDASKPVASYARAPRCAAGPEQVTWTVFSQSRACAPRRPGRPRRAPAPRARWCWRFSGRRRPRSRRPRLVGDEASARPRTPRPCGRSPRGPGPRARSRRGRSCRCCRRRTTVAAVRAARGREEGDRGPRGAPGRAGERQQGVGLAKELLKSPYCERSENRPLGGEQAAQLGDEVAAADGGRVGVADLGRERELGRRAGVRLRRAVTGVGGDVVRGAEPGPGLGGGPALVPLAAKARTASAVRPWSG